MTINIYFGDINKELAITAAKADLRAFLIDQSNYSEFLNTTHNKDVTVYTSLGDLPKDTSVIYQLLDLADNIYYCPPTLWSDNKKIDFKNISASVQGSTEFILYEFKQQKNNVHNLDLSAYSVQFDLYTALTDSRKTNDPQLWIAGCSISHGVGVDSIQRYGQLLADKLNLPVSFLTRPGSSISWAVDQLVRSDIRSDDIVILGLTEEFRFPYWTRQNEVWHVCPTHQPTYAKLPFTNLSTNMIDKLITDDNCFYQSVIRIQQLINFSNKLNAKLIILGLLCSPSLAVQLNNIYNFINYKNFKSLSMGPVSFADLGTDDSHPGPLQHQLYADFCQSALKKLNYI
jgi:hypothetical protein